MLDHLEISFEPLIDHLDVLLLEGLVFGESGFVEHLRE